MVICVGIAVTRLLDGCSRGTEEATWWKYCARAFEPFLAVSKISTVTEAACVLPAGQKFLKDAYGCLAVSR